jgi:hypothetical protein
MPGKRNLDFDLDEVALRTIFQGLCYYCGAEPSQICRSKSGRSEFIYNGIDRIDNSVGYCESNVVPCCQICNYAKRDMNFSEFIAWIKRVYTHTFKATDSTTNRLHWKIDMSDDA